jgi:aspartokinase
LVVQKFGGTSVADPDAIRRLINIARSARTRDSRGPVVVVSAMSRVTDALLTVAADAGSSQLDRALAQIDQLRARHLATAKALVPSADAAPLLAAIDQQFDELAAVARALGVLREVSVRTLDVVAAIGELLSSRIVAAACVHEGLPAVWVDARLGDAAD